MRRTDNPLRDGSVVTEELASLVRQMEEVVKMLMRQTGVSEEEATAEATRQFAMMDKDSDGKITFNEYCAFHPPTWVAE